MEWPKTLTGWLGVITSLILITGVGSVAAVWRRALMPLRKEIMEEKKERIRCIEQERKDREQAVKDEARERISAFDRIDNREHGALTLHKRELKRDIDEVGGRVNALQQDTIDREARTRSLEDRMHGSEQDRITIHREHGQVSARVTAVEEKVSEIAVNIIGAVQSAKEETLRAVDGVREKVNALGEQVAVIRDRQERDGQRRDA